MMARLLLPVMRSWLFELKTVWVVTAEHVWVSRSAKLIVIAANTMTAITLRYCKASVQVTNRPNG